MLEELTALANSGTGEFIRKSAGSLVNATLSETIALSGLSDVTISSVVQGNILYYNGSAWVNLAVGTSGQFLQTQGVGANPQWADESAGGGSGTVTSVSVVTANGVSGSVATATTTPAITLTLGAITPSAVQISGLTASEIVGTDASKNLVSLAAATYPSLTELSYLKGITSAIQTQIDGKSPTAGNASLVTVGTITAGVWNGTDVPVSAGGTGISTISALSIWLANALNTVTEITPGAGNSIRVNGAGTAWEAFTPSSSTPTIITVANEATDTTCFPLFVTAATGDLGPKTNAGLAFNSNAGLLTATGFSGPLTGNVTGNASGTAATVTGAAQASITSLGTLTTLTVDDITINGNTISSAGASSLAITPTAGQAILLDATISIDAGVVTGATSITSTTFVGALTGTASGNLVSSGALGTPSSGTGTNITGIPAANILAGSLGTGAYVMDSSLQLVTIELGHATDTTIARVSAGVVSIEGVSILTVAGGTLTGSITLGENTGIALDPAGSADGKWSGITITGTGGATIAFGRLVYLKAADSRWWETDADATATGGAVMVGMTVTSTTAGAAVTILLLGQIRADASFPALTIGAPVYVGETAGDIQVAIPTGADNVIRVVGYALTADEIYFCPSQDHQISVA